MEGIFRSLYECLQRLNVTESNRNHLLQWLNAVAGSVMTEPRVIQGTAWEVRESPGVAEQEMVLMTIESGMPLPNHGSIVMWERTSTASESFMPVNGMRRHRVVQKTVLNIVYLSTTEGQVLKIAVTMHREYEMLYL